MKSRIVIFDIIIVIIVSALTFFAAYTAYMKPQGNAQILIQGQGREWTFPIDAEETIVVSGPIGNTIIKLKENSAWIESSPCDNQTCVAEGSVSKQGQWAACLPNGVLLIVEGKKDVEVDSIAW